MIPRRRKKNNKPLVTLLIVASLGVAFYFTPENLPKFRAEERDNQTRNSAPAKSLQKSNQEGIKYGNPSGAGNFDSKNYLVDRTAYQLSYNSDLGGPNWVAWKLVAQDDGTTPRQEFYTDPILLALEQAVSSNGKLIAPSDYSGSGFDRGHICPHDDRSSNAELASQTYAMSNINPQAPRLNRGPWLELEKYCRKISKRGKTLYIISGGIGIGGDGEQGPRTQIGKENQIIVPAFLWKIILILPENEDITKAQILCVALPNTQSVNPNWKHYRISLQKLEKATGYKFFEKIADIQTIPDYTF